MELKPLNANAIDSALEKARHYRLLNDPENAESICRDIMAHDEKHQAALQTLILSLADQFAKRSTTLKKARTYLEGLESEYDQSYYAGLICERSARTRLASAKPGSKQLAFDLLCEAMEHFEKAESLSDETNDDAVLRWNACVRTIQKHKLKAREADEYVPYGD